MKFSIRVWNYFCGSLHLKLVAGIWEEIRFFNRKD